MRKTIVLVLMGAAACSSDGTGGDLFPPKTTRHLLAVKLPESPVPLKDLM